MILNQEGKQLIEKLDQVEKHLKKKYKSTPSRSNVLSFGFKRDSVKILSCLADSKNKHTHYTDMMMKINFRTKNSIFAYYVKRCVKYGLITVDRTKSYSITDKGRIVLKMFHQLDEKFICENPLDICQNSNGDYEHKYNSVCVNCGNVKPGDPKC